ncbi:MFS transporter [Streptomyces sp. NBC_01619]|uniref:MFS transporter n=1 Tax=Streptomyces sp. NBC_01619 TaxID=2975901 RepID=UPI00338F1B8B
MSRSESPAPPSWRAPFARYVIGRGVSTAGTGLVNVVLAFAVLRTGGDGFSVGLVLACSVLTQTLLIPVGGVIADRVDRRTVVVLGNAVLAAAHGTMGLLLLLAPDRVTVWTFVAAAATTGAAAAAVQPAPGTHRPVGAADGAPAGQRGPAAGPQRGAYRRTRPGGDARRGLRVRAGAARRGAGVRLVLRRPRRAADQHAAARHEGRTGGRARAGPRSAAARGCGGTHSRAPSPCRCGWPGTSCSAR